MFAAGAQQGIWHSVTSLRLRMLVSWDVMLYCLVSGSQHLEEF